MGGALSIALWLLALHRWIAPSASQSGFVGPAKTRQAGGGEELAAAGGASITPARANASIAIFQFPFSRFSLLNQLPWMVLSLTVSE